MKNKGQKKLLIIIGIVLALTSIVAIYLSLKRNDIIDDPSIEPNNPIIDNEPEINKEIERLIDEKTYFKIQDAINEYYNKLVDQDKTGVLEILEGNYILENNINKDNVFEKINSKYESVNYAAKKIFYNKNSSVTYYFINGYVINSTVIDGKFSYESNVSYLVIVKNNKYAIKPLESNIDNIEEYANNYDLSDIEVSNISLKSNNLSEKNKLVSYISQFISLLVVDSERAYNMLDEETKNKYISYQDFESRKLETYNSLSTNIFSYSYSEDEKTYYIKDEEQNTIKIIENYVMDYQISF